MNLATLLAMVTDAVADDVVVVCGSEELTGAELFARAGRAAAAIGDARASAVAWVDPNDVALPVALLASLWAGVPFMPLNYRLSAEQLVGLAERYPGVLVLGRGQAAETLAGAGTDVVAPDAVCARADGPTAPPWEEDPEAVAVLLHTSGTTAAPKAAVLRHRHLTSYVLGATELLGALGESAVISVPPYHIAGMANLLTNFFAGRKLVYLPAFSAPAWLDAVAHEAAARAMLVPTMLARVVEELEARDQTAPASLLSLSYGGARTPRPLLERALARFPGVGFVNAYGLTETASTIAVLGPEDHDGARSGDPVALGRLDSVGRVLPDVEVEIVSADGEVLPAGEIGEIRVRGAQVSGEYLGRSSSLDADGWFFTRDMGWLDADGYLFVQGRNDDTIIRGGENIAPEEIETVLYRHPAIAEVAVIGMPDEEWGEIIVAIVVPNQALSEEEVRAFARAELRSSKTPDRVVFRDQLPYSPTGKLQRNVLRHDLAPTDSAPAQ
ncbi:MAG: fatty acid--CoA ligase family protein [Acidimicrobiales bacterium]